MTVEKFRFTKDDSDYTTFPNLLLQGLCHAEALGVYVYLSSLPPSWEFHKDQIRKHFNIGRDKLEKILCILLAHGLIQIFQERNLAGQFNNWRLHVNNPCTFKPLTDFQGTDKTPVVDAFQPFTDLPFTANQSLVNSSYKRNNKKNKDFKKNKHKSFLVKKSKSAKCASVDNSKRHAFAESMDQMANEQKHIEEHNNLKAQELLMKRSNGVSPLLADFLNKRNQNHEGT